MLSQVGMEVKAAAGEPEAGHLHVLRESSNDTVCLLLDSIVWVGGSDKLK